MLASNCRVFFSGLQAAHTRSLVGRLVRGVTPVVTYPATAARGGVMSGVAAATSPVRSTFLVAKWVGKGLLDYASLTENRQEGASSRGSAAADPSVPSTDDTPAATSSQVGCLCCMQHVAFQPLLWHLLMQWRLRQLLCWLLHWLLPCNDEQLQWLNSAGSFSR